VLTCASSSVSSAGSILLEALPQPELQLARSLFRERHRHDLRHRGLPAGKHAQDAIDELGSLAGARGRLDDQRIVKIPQDRFTS